jgi:tRNA dimethylallyltransferase
VKEKMIVIVGPTAVGKTRLGVELAKKFDGEVISGDSMQIYRGLDIGTAKVTEEEAEGIPHHLINEKDPDESYAVSDFKEVASKKIEAIRARGHVPIVVGGTGLYIESLLFDVSHGGEAEPDEAFRKQMEEKAEKEGKESVWEQLKEIDPEAAKKIHHNNVRRVIRALEVYHVTGQTFSSYQAERQEKEALYDAFVIGLNTDRALLYERINQRVDLMMEQGLVEEAKRLWQAVDVEVQSAKGIGYKELFPFFEGKEDLEEAVDNIKQNSKRYAKRQLTWFRNRFEVDAWFDLVENPEQVTECEEQVQKFLNR